MHLHAPFSTTVALSSSPAGVKCVWRLYDRLCVLAQAEVESTNQKELESQVGVSVEFAP